MSKGRGDDKERWAFEMPKELTNEIRKEQNYLESMLLFFLCDGFNYLDRSEDN